MAIVGWVVKLCRGGGMVGPFEQDIVDDKRRVYSLASDCGFWKSDVGGCDE